MSESAFLAVQHLGVEFRTRHGLVEALKNVSLELHKGETLGIVGESGSGKSVTAYTVMGLLDQAGKVSTGTAHFDGINLIGARESTLKDLRGREISMIFQNPRGALNPIRPVGKQIEDVLLRHARATRQNAREKAIEMLAQVRIVDPHKRYWAYPFELSGGMCQRVMISIALACDPRLLIADEPTTGLDVTTQKATMDLIQDLTRERHMAVILITHDLGMAAAYSDRIMVMQQGQVVEQADVKTLFTQAQHPYTRKLIAASPGPRSTLAALTATEDESVAQKPASRNRADVSVQEADCLLEVVDLVKEFPLKGARRAAKNKPESAAFRAVDGISFKMFRGESLGLVGESGCGKSTTSSMINRLLDPSAGQVLFNGEDITAIPSKTFTGSPLRGQIQMVFQDHTESLNPRFSAQEAIAEPLKRLQGLKDKAEIRKQVERCADWVGLPHSLLSRFPHQLSGGQKARVGIARAISVQPQLLILDEPTSALDVSVQAVVLQLLDRLKRELGMSYLFVSHDLNVVRLLCERVIVMNRGKIVEQGATEKVLQNPSETYTQQLIDAIPHFEPDRL